MKRFTLAVIFAAFFSLFAVEADAASIFWIGGTGTWDGASQAHWSSASGGTTCSCLPTSTSDVIFDGSSGAGTVTVNTTVDINSLDFSAASSLTVDFSVNNNNVTLEGINGTTASAFNGSGTSTRGLNMGNGTWTVKQPTGNNLINFNTTTGLAFNANGSTVVYTPASAPSNNVSFALGGLPWNAITINAGGFSVFRRVILTTATITTLTLNAGVNFFPNNNLTITTLNVNGTSSSNVVTMGTLDAGTKTLTVTSATINWAAIGGIVFAGSAITANSSFNQGGNSGTITINGPSGGGGGGGHIIGG